MSFLSICTKRINLAETPAVRRWGVAGARRFWLGWGAFMYLLLALISGYGLSGVVMLDDERSARFIIYTAVALIVLAASLLTRMLMRVLAELRSLELAGEKGGNPK